MVRWVWQSISPGSTVFFERSITSAPAGMASPGPAAVTRSPWMRITASRTGGPPWPSISRPARTATVLGAGSGAAAAKESRASARPARDHRALFIGHLVRVGWLSGGYGKRVWLWRPRQVGPHHPGPLL